MGEKSEPPLAPPMGRQVRASLKVCSKPRNDGKVNVGSETQAALVGAEGRVVLHAVTTVDVILKVIVHPDNTELDGALGLDHALKQAGLLVLGVGVDDRLEGRQDFFDGLQEFGLIRVLGLGLGKNSLNVSVHDK